MMPNLATILSNLMKEHDISASELSRRTGIVQPVIYRMMTGETDNPKVTTLIPLAQYFNISIDQLVGTIAIATNNKQKLHSGNISTLPILTWEQANQWPQIDVAMCNSFYTMTEEITPNAFALPMRGSSMQPQFQEGTVLIFEITTEPKDKDFALVLLKEQQELTFRQLYYDGNDIILKPLNSDFKIFHVAKNDCVIKGVLFAAYTKFK